MIRFEVIDAKNPEYGDLDHKLNKWIETKKSFKNNTDYDIKIIQLKFSTVLHEGKLIHSALIMYETN